MKVAIITGEIKYIVTGSERYLNEVALYLTKKGVDTTLFTIREKQIPGRKINPNYAKLRNRFSSIKKKSITPSIVKVGPLHTSFYYFKDLPKDSIIYLPSNMYVHLLNILLKPPKQKYLIGSHVLQFKSYYQSGSHEVSERTFNKTIKNLLKLRGNTSKKNLFFHVINLQQRHYLQKEFGIKEENIIYAPIFVKVNKYKIGRNNSKLLKIVHIGGTGKNALQVVKTIKTLIARKQIENYEFHFIGKNEPPELDILAEKYPNIINHNMATDDEKSKILSNSDVLIVPSIEAFPQTVLEGLSSGLSVVSRKNSINAELKEQNADIIDVERETPVAFADALGKLLISKQNGNLSNKRKKKNRQIVINNFSFEIVMPKVFKMFKQVDDA